MSGRLKQLSFHMHLSLTSSSPKSLFVGTVLGSKPPAQFLGKVIMPRGVAARVQLTVCVCVCVFQL